MSNPPVDVQALGQSIWMDNIRRKLLLDGTYQSYIDHMGVVGVTSNPTIFQKAIGGSDDYDADIIANPELEAVELFEKLAIDDIRTAADLFGRCSTAPKAATVTSVSKFRPPSPTTPPPHWPTPSAYSPRSTGPT